MEVADREGSRLVVTAAHGRVHAIIGATRGWGLTSNEALNHLADLLASEGRWEDDRP